MTLATTNETDPAGPADPSPEATLRPGVASVDARLDSRPGWRFLATAPRLRPVVRQKQDPVFADRAVEEIELDVIKGFPLCVDRVVSRLAASYDRDSDSYPAALLLKTAVTLLKGAHDVTTAQACSLLDVDRHGMAGLLDAVGRAITGEDATTSPDPESGEPPASVQPRPKKGPVSQEPRTVSLADVENEPVPDDVAGGLVTDDVVDEAVAEFVGAGVGR